MSILIKDVEFLVDMISELLENYDTVNLVLVRTVKNNYFSLCTN